MKTLIIYATKSGAARESAELLAAKLGNCTLCNASKPLPAIDADALIIGSGVRMGKIYRPAKNFIQKNSRLLLSKKLAFYLCGAYPETLQDAIEKNIPKDLARHAVRIENLGGKPPFSSPRDQNWLRMEGVEALVSAMQLNPSL